MSNCFIYYYFLIGISEHLVQLILIHVANINAKERAQYYMDANPTVLKPLCSNYSLCPNKCGLEGLVPINTTYKKSILQKHTKFLTKMISWADDKHHLLLIWSFQNPNSPVGENQHDIKIQPLMIAFKPI